MADKPIARENAKAIVNAAIASRTQLTTLDHELQEEIDEIELKAARDGRPLSESDKERRRSLRASQMEVEDSFEALAFATLARLDSSADVQELKDRIEAISGHLSDDLERLKKIQRSAKIAAKVAEGLAQLATKVASALA